jgi:hypothetical protein
MNFNFELLMLVNADEQILAIASMTVLDIKEAIIGATSSEHQSMAMSIKSDKLFE